MERTVGTVVRGLRAPIIKEGDDIVEIVVDTLLNAAKEEGTKSKIATLLRLPNPLSRVRKGITHQLTISQPILNINFRMKRWGFSSRF